MALTITSAASFGTNPVIASDPKNAAGGSTSTASDAASSAKDQAEAAAAHKTQLANHTAKTTANVRAATLAANKILLAKQAASAAANAKEANEQRNGTEEPSGNLGTQFSAKA